MTLALQDTEGNIATTFEEKEEMIRRVMCPALPDENIPVIEKIEGRAYEKVTKEHVREALF